MRKSILDEDLVLLDYEASSRDDLLKSLGQVLLEKGYVKPSYIQSLIERENRYPTGLDTHGVQVAIPHTNSIHVNKTAVLVAKLKKPIVFKDMANEANEVSAKIIFMIAMKNPEEQLSTLSKLMDIFSNHEKLLHLKNCQDEKNIIQILLS